MKTEDIDKLETLLAAMRPGPYEYWDQKNNDFIVAECKDDEGVPIASLPGMSTKKKEFTAIVALLNAAPSLLKAARDNVTLRSQMLDAANRVNGHDCLCSGCVADAQVVKGYCDAFLNDSQPDTYTSDDSKVKGWTRIGDELPPPGLEVMTWDRLRGRCIGYWIKRDDCKPGAYWSINGQSGGLGTPSEIRPPTHWRLQPLDPEGNP